MIFQRSQRQIKSSIYWISPVLAAFGLLGMSLPSTAVTATYDNDYRACAGRLKSVGVSVETSASSCADALRPQDLAGCVVKIKKQTQLATNEILSGCTQARRPIDLSSCVAGISYYTKELANPAVLGYCRRSLLPAQFAQCVVGIRRELDFASNQALDACSNAGERAANYLPSFVPVGASSGQVSPYVPTTPAPGNPGSDQPPNLNTPQVNPSVNQNSPYPTQVNPGTNQNSSPYPTQVNPGNSPLTFPTPVNPGR